MEYKTCGKCGLEKEATTEYWHKDNQGLHGLHSYCKVCRNAKRKSHYVLQKKKGIPQQYYEDNKIRYLVMAMRKRGYKDLTEQQLETIIYNFTNKEGYQECAYCGRIIKEDSMRHFDHYIPYSKGGANTLTNLIVTCKYCNRSKAHDDFSIWIRDQYFYSKEREERVLEYIRADKFIKFY